MHLVLNFSVLTRLLKLTVQFVDINITNIQITIIYKYTKIQKYDNIQITIKY